MHSFNAEGHSTLPISRFSFDVQRGMSSFRVSTSYQYVEFKVLQSVKITAMYYIPIHDNNYDNYIY